MTQADLHLAFAAMLAAAIPSYAHANASAEMDMATFDAAQASGRPVIIDTFAPWCPPCRVQAPLIGWLHNVPAFRNVLVLRIGERTPRAVWRRFRVNAFGTLIVYRNSHEVARGTPVDAAGIARLFDAAVNQK